MLLLSHGPSSRTTVCPPRSCLQDVSQDLSLHRVLLGHVLETHLLSCVLSEAAASATISRGEGRPLRSGRRTCVSSEERPSPPLRDYVSWPLECRLRGWPGAPSSWPLEPPAPWPTRHVSASSILRSVSPSPLTYASALPPPHPQRAMVLVDLCLSYVGSFSAGL